MGTGRCLSSSRVASQPLGFESLILRGHSTVMISLDTKRSRFIIKSDRQCPVANFRPRMTTGAFVFLGCWNQGRRLLPVFIGALFNLMPA